MTELEAGYQKEEEAKKIREMRKGREDRDVEDSGTETEGTGDRRQETQDKSQRDRLLRPEDAQGPVRKRTVSGDVSSGEMSTDSEWDKVSEAGDMET